MQLKIIISHVTGASLYYKTVSILVKKILLSASAITTPFVLLLITLKRQLCRGKDYAVWVIREIYYCFKNFKTLLTIVEQWKTEFIPSF